MFSQQVYWGGLPFPSPVYHILSELSAMTRPSWVALHGMALSFIELCKPLRHDNAVIHEGDKCWRDQEETEYMEGEGEVTQSCPTLCDPMDCSPPGSSIHGIFQARVLELVATSFYKGSSQPRLNSGLLHCRQTLYHLSHQGSYELNHSFSELCGCSELHQILSISSSLRFLSKLDNQ